MEEALTVPLDEVKSVFFVLEELIDFLHQPLNYETTDQIVQFLQSGAFDRLTGAYYDTVWNWFPDNVRNEIIER